MKHEKEYCWSRDFLNNEIDQLGAIAVCITREGNAVHGTLHIGDCSRTIQLDLFCHKNDIDVMLQLRLQKLAKIRAAVDLAEAALRKACRDALMYKPKET